MSTVASPPCPVCAGRARPEDRFGAAPMLRCESCGFTFVHGELDPELYRDAYFEAYVGGDYLAQAEQRRHESRVRLGLLARFAPPPARLLELGAAAGFFLDEARRAGYAGLGVELNDAMATYGRETLGVDVRTGALGEIELGGEPFDAACAFHVVEHLDNPADTLTTIADMLRPGGHVLIEVPNAESATARRRGASWPPLDLPYHVGHFGPRSMRALLERAGFEVLRVDTVPFAHYASASRAGRLARGLAESARSGRLLPPAPHPDAHQLLRAVGRRPAG